MGNFDGILDDVIVNAKAAASAISKKAGEVCITSKQKISAAEMRSEMNKKLRDLGAVTYKMSVNEIDLTDDVTQLVAEIAEIKENLAIINHNIANAKNQKHCPVCGNNVPKNSVFCNICGAKLQDFEQTEESDTEEETVADETASTDNAEPTVNEQTVETTEQPQSDEVL